MDTKWKRLFNDRRKNYGISQSDMYQMFAYSKKYDAKHVWVLYPKTDELNVNDITTYKDATKNSETEVHVFFIDVENIITSLELLRESILHQTQQDSVIAKPIC